MPTEKMSPDEIRSQSDILYGPDSSDPARPHPLDADVPDWKPSKFAAALAAARTYPCIHCGGTGSRGQTVCPNCDGYGTTLTASGLRGCERAQQRILSRG